MKKSRLKNDLSRREFLTKGSAGLGCLGLLTMSANVITPDKKTNFEEKKKNVLFYSTAWH